MKYGTCKSKREKTSTSKQTGGMKEGPCAFHPCLVMVGHSSQLETMTVSRVLSNLSIFYPNIIVLYAMFVRADIELGNLLHVLINQKLPVHP